MPLALLASGNVAATFATRDCRSLQRFIAVSYVVGSKNGDVFSEAIMVCQVKELLKNKHSGITLSGRLRPLCAGL